MLALTEQEAARLYHTTLDRQTRRYAGATEEALHLCMAEWRLETLRISSTLPGAGREGPRVRGLQDRGWTTPSGRNNRIAEHAT